MKRSLGHRKWVPVLVAVIVTAALAGCTTPQRSSHAGDAASTAQSVSPRASTSPSTPSSVLPSPWASAKETPAQKAAAQAALAAYQGMWSDLVRFGQSSDWKNRELGRYMTGDVLSSWSSSIAQNKAKGLIVLGSPRTAPYVFVVSPAAQPNTVEIADCVDDSNWLQYVASTGKLADHDPGGRHWSEAAVTFDPTWQRWLVSQQLLGRKGSC